MKLITQKQFAENEEERANAYVFAACPDVDIRRPNSPDPNIRQFTISTGSVDSHNSILSPKGWVLKSFMRNGPLLWAHDKMLPPIGHATKVWRSEDKLKARFRFTSADHKHPLGDGFGHSVMRLYDEGFMKSVSVGFKPLDFEIAEDRDDGKGPIPINYKKQELVEVSALPLGSNKDALVEATGRGINCEPIYSWVESIRDTEHPIVTRAIADEILSGRNVITVQVPEDLEVEEESNTEQTDPQTLCYNEAMDNAIRSETDLINEIKSLVDQVEAQGQILNSRNQETLTSVMSALTGLLVEQEFESRGCDCENCDTQEPEPKEPEKPETKPAPIGVTRKEAAKILKDALSSALTGR